MSALTEQDVLAHQEVVPWPELHQVEQDLLLCRAMVAIFDDDFLKAQVAMRGGTVLHKVHLAPASRYSQDIDLVVVGDRPENHIRRALNRVLRPILGKEKSSAWDYVKLTVRNAARPSRILRVIYTVPSIIAPGMTLTIEVEANVEERFPHYPLQHLPFSVPFRDVVLDTTLVSYNIDEMLGTKMRALFQRTKGRDLFDLYWALTATAAYPVSRTNAIAAFRHYMAAESTSVGRNEFVASLQRKLKDIGFRTDMLPLLLTGVAYDPDEAGRVLEERLLSLLPE